MTEEKTEKIVYVNVDSIKIPEDRVTSQLDEEIYNELKESISKHGILQPLQLAQVGKDLVLIDGLHRLVIAKELGLEKVPAVIREMSEEELLITNLIVNRQRGKSNPAHEAKVLRKLIDEYGLGLDQAATKLGMSVNTAEKYYRIATKCTQKTLNYLEQGLLSVGCAYWLSYISDIEKQNQYADYAVQYTYTVEQCKAAAFQAETGTVTESARYIITPEGEPKPRPITVYPCGQEVEPSRAITILIDKEVWPLIEQLFQQACAEGLFTTLQQTPEQPTTQEQPQTQQAQKKDWFAESLSKL